MLHVTKRFHAHFVTSNGDATIEDITKKTETCRMMLELRHPNIVAVLGLLLDPTDHFPLLVMEKLGGSLQDLFETIPNVRLVLRLSILEDVAKGLSYLHNHHPQIIHTHLTATNVLLTKSLNAKISDCGDSYLVNPRPDIQDHSPFTMAYMPPEAKNDDSLQANPSFDVFSFGHLILVTLMQVAIIAMYRSTPIDLSLVVLHGPSCTVLFSEVSTVQGF